MGGKRRFDISQNVAKGFVMMKKDLEEFAKETNKSMIEVYDMFLSDLQNYYDDNYEKKIEEIELTSFSRESINKIYEHVSKIKKNLEEKELKDKKRQEKQQADEEKTQEMKTKWSEIETQISKAVLEGKQGTEKEIVQRFISDINKEDSGYDAKTKKYIGKKLKLKLENIKNKEKKNAKGKQQESRQEKEEMKKVEKAMEQIRAVVEREYSNGNIENKAKYMTAIRDMITGDDEHSEFETEMTEIEKEQLLKLLDKNINKEKDEIYFEQVRAFTDDFRFLRSYSETANAMYGAKKRKFTDIESYHRYSALREKLLKSNNEYLQIDRLLESKKIDDADKRILLARKEYMDREIQSNNKIGEVR